MALAGCWIYDCLIFPNYCSFCNDSGRELGWAKDMADFVATRDQVVDDDPTMAAPPQNFRTHDCAPMLSAEEQQPCKTAGERLGKGIVRIIVKAAHPPAAVLKWVHNA